MIGGSINAFILPRQADNQQEIIAQPASNRLGMELATFVISAISFSLGSVFHFIATPQLSPSVHIREFVVLTKPLEQLCKIPDK